MVSRLECGGVRARSTSGGFGSIDGGSDRKKKWGGKARRSSKNLKGRYQAGELPNCDCELKEC